MNLYNEIDKDASQWLRNLIDTRELPIGHVEENSITELSPSELEDYTQVHLFAGIGGWPLALKLARWPEDKPVWTGSCPCQPFSVAGKQKGNEDERHLWPEMYRLIKECKPPIIFGEQVASPDGIDWMQAVQNDLEESGYEVGKLDLCAAGIGAPHIRQRILWVAYNSSERHEQSGSARSGRKRFEDNSTTGEVAHGGREGLERHSGNGNDWNQSRRDDQNETGSTSKGGANSNWNNTEWLRCRDNKLRPTQPGLFPLAHGLPRCLGDSSTREQRMELMAAKRSRKIQLKGYGNAIVPQLAAIFIRSVMEWIKGREL